MCGGLIIGAIAAIALIKVAKCAFRYHHYGYGGRHCGGGGHGYGYHGDAWHGGWGNGRFGRGGPPWARHFGGDGEGDEGEARGGFGKRYFLRFLFERLDTTPGQEKVILEAFDEIKEAMKKAKGEWRTSFSDFAKAIRGTEFDHGAVGEAFVRHDGLFEQARMAVITALQKVHEALDEKQRAILADLIEAGPGRFKGRFSGRGPEWV
jgi:hypothetical protein